MLLVALAVAPGLFWLWYFLARDRLRPEPRSLVGRVFFLGALGAVAAALLEQGIFGAAGLSLQGAPAAGVLAAAVAVSLIEEGVKFLAVFGGAYRHHAFDEVLDGIVYAVAAALGFATVENLAYVLQGGAAVGLLRAFLAVPGHAFFGAVMGFYMGLAKFAAGRRETGWLITGVLLATAAHTLYDALVFSRTYLAFGVIPFLFYLWRQSVAHASHAQAIDNRQRPLPD
jgi:RsiW-degrading membrane proteinase PrsW (M82 family)